MRTFKSAVTTGMTAIVFIAAFANAAHAKCGFSAASRLGTAPQALQSLMVKSEQPLRERPDPSDTLDPAPSIVGLWNVQFLAGGQVVDAGFDVWNMDGTETLNDTSAPSSGNVCLGVWSKTGPMTYKLKHPSWIYDDAGVNVIGVVMIREQITLSPNGKTYSGDLVIDAYDLSGNLLQHNVGTIVGQRITADDDPFQTSGIPGLPVMGKQ